MSYHPVSKDLKARIPALFYEQNFKVKEICALLDIKKSLVYRTLDYFRKYNVPYNPHAHKSGRPRSLSQRNLKFIVALLDRRHCIYLDEIQDQLQNEQGVTVSTATLLRTLRRLHYSRKCVSAQALERDDLLRSAFMNRIADEVPSPDMLMFIDESACNKKTSARRRGWSLVGHKCVQRACFVRGQRFSILPILTLDGIIMYDIIPGSVTSERFIQFLRELVIPLTNPYPGPRSVLILDNCNIHHCDEVRELVEDEAHCKLIFLPPYSPDLNPIEQAFSAIKSYLKRHFQDFSFSVIDAACKNITQQNAWGFFRASGYVA